jgi:hypothetical protein
MRRKVGALLISFAVLAAGCAPSPPESSGDEAGTPPEIGADGRAPTDLALLEFAAAFGPLPGVEGDGRGSHPSGTGPLRWVLSNWDSLSADQQAAVAAVLGAGEVVVAAAPRVLAAGTGPVAVGSSGDVDSLALLQLAGQVEQTIAARLGRPLGIPVEIRIAPQLVDGDAYGFASFTDAAGGWQGVPVLCEITFTKAGVDAFAGLVTGGVPTDEQLWMMAHEMFHCFQATAGGATGTEFSKRVAWVTEGMAEWAATELAPLFANAHWEYTGQGWLSQTGLDLFKRSYAAIGFWAHVHSHGASVWTIADEVGIVAGSSSDAYDVVLAASGGGAELLTTWGAQYFRDASLAPAWDIEGNGLPDGTGPSFSAPITPGETFGFDVGERGAGAFLMDLASPVVTMRGDGQGMVRLPDGVEIVLARHLGEVLCTDPAGCTCPEGTGGVNAIFRVTIPGEARLGLAGHRAGADILVRGWSLDDFCEQYEPFPESCFPGRWTSTQYLAIDQETTGGVGIGLVIDRQGQGEITYTGSTPIFARVISPTAVWVRMQQSGSARFGLSLTGPSTAAVTGGVTFGYTIVAHADIGGSWVQTVEPISLSGAMLGGTSRFLCNGGVLHMVAQGGIAEYTFVRLDGTPDPLPPPQGGDPIEVGTGDPGGGSGTTVPPGWGSALDPCALLTLAEVNGLMPGASAPAAGDVLLLPALRQCSFPGGMVVQVTPPQSQAQYEPGLSVFDLDSTPIPGIGVWALLGINKPDPQFGITDTVFLVAGASEAGTVTLIPLDDFDQDSPQVAYLIELLKTALSRL